MPRAAVCTAIDTPLEIVDLELQAPKANEVKVRLGASGVCHSDLSVRNGTLLAPLPAVLGHEGAGVIEEVGEGVEHLQPGDHVVISWIPQCRECYFCADEQGHLCEVGLPTIATGSLLDGTPRSCATASRCSRCRPAARSRSTRSCPRSSAVKIDKDIPLDGGGADRLRRAHRLRRRPQHGRHPPGRHGRGDRLRWRRPQRDPGRQALGRRADHRDRHGRREAPDGPEVRGHRPRERARRRRSRQGDGAHRPARRRRRVRGDRAPRDDRPGVHHDAPGRSDGASWACPRWT